MTTNELSSVGWLMPYYANSGLPKPESTESSATESDSPSIYPIDIKPTLGISVPDPLIGPIQEEFITPPALMNNFSNYINMAFLPWMAGDVPQIEMVKLPDLTVPELEIEKMAVQPLKTAYREITDIPAEAERLKNEWGANSSRKKTHLTDEFYIKVVEIAQRIKCDPNDLMYVMNAESGIKANNPNKKSGAQGLIQFMPSVAKEFGTSTEALGKMTEVEQLEYVEKYFTRWKRALNLKDSPLSLGQLYALVFTPAYANREVLVSKDSEDENSRKFYAHNTALDVDGDNRITWGDLEQRVYNLA